MRMQAERQVAGKGSNEHVHKAIGSYARRNWGGMKNRLCRLMLAGVLAVSTLSACNLSCEMEKPPTRGGVGVKKQEGYLIITRQMFVKELEKFVELKEKEGFEVAVMTVEEIGRDYSGQDITHKMKECIREHYQNGHKYVLLVGDSQVNGLNEGEFGAFKATPDNAVKAFSESQSLNEPWNAPTSYFLKKVTPREGIKHSVEVNGRSVEIHQPVYQAAGTDLFYADLREWDPDGNGYNDHADVTGKIGFEVRVGRWPVRTTEEVRKITSKMQRLKPAAEMFVYTDGSLGFCTEIAGTIPSSVSVTCMVNIAGKDKTESDEGVSPHPKIAFEYIDVMDPASSEQRDAHLSTGRKLVSASAHGNHNGMAFGRFVTARDLKFRGVLPLFEVQSCAVSEFFGAETTFSEALLRGETGPAVVATPTTRKEFYSRVFEGARIGDAFYDTLDSSRLGGSGWTILLGDPSAKAFQP